MLVDGVFRPRLRSRKPRSLPRHCASAEECHSVSWTTRVPRRRPCRKQYLLHADPVEWTNKHDCKTSLLSRDAITSPPQRKRHWFLASTTFQHSGCLRQPRRFFMDIPVCNNNAKFILQNGEAKGDSRRSLMPVYMMIDPRKTACLFHNYSSLLITFRFRKHNPADSDHQVGQVGPRW